MRDQDQKVAADARDWRDVANKIEIQLLIEGCIDRIGYICRQA